MTAGPHWINALNGWFLACALAWAASAVDGIVAAIALVVLAVLFWIVGTAEWVLWSRPAKTKDTIE